MQIIGRKENDRVHILTRAVTGYTMDYSPIPPSEFLQPSFICPCQWLCLTVWAPDSESVCQEKCMCSHPLIPESSGWGSLTKTGYRHATIPSPSLGFLCSLFWRVSGIPLLPPANESDAVTYILVSGIPATSWGWPNDKS